MNAINAMNKKQSLIGAAIFVALNIASQSALGAGFALIETNARGQGNAYAGAAAHTPDASTIFFNPAGMADLDSSQVVIASHIILPDAKFTNNGSSNAAVVGGGAISGDNADGGFDAFVPNIYWVTVLNDDVRFGLGINSPFGLATKYDDDWVGRYHGVVSDLKIINVNPSVSYRIDESLSFGGGLNLMLADIDLSNAIDFAALLGQEAGSSDGFVGLSGDNFGDISLGFNLGVQYRINEDIKLGIAYRSEVDVDVKGEGDFTVPSSAALLVAGGHFVDTGLQASISLPASFSFSLAQQIDEQFTFLADITWTGWSSFEELRIEFDNALQPDGITTENWEDTLRYSVGVDYQHSEKLTLRTGIALDETPVPSAERRTPRLPDSDRTWVSLGLSYALEDNLSFDVGYSHLFLDDADINNTVESSNANVKATLNGNYTSSVNIVSLQLNWKY